MNVVEIMHIICIIISDAFYVRTEPFIGNVVS
jgi:hypothetical protein